MAESFNEENRDYLAAKAEKNYALADEIRKEIADKGFILVDTKDGFTIKKV